MNYIKLTPPGQAGPGYVALPMSRQVERYTVQRNAGPSLRLHC